MSETPKTFLDLVHLIDLFALPSFSSTSTGSVVVKIKINSFSSEANLSGFNFVSETPKTFFDLKLFQGFHIVSVDGQKFTFFGVVVVQSFLSHRLFDKISVRGGSLL